MLCPDWTGLDSDSGSSTGLDWIRISGSWIWTGLDRFNSIHSILWEIPRTVRYIQSLTLPLCSHALHPAALKIPRTVSFRSYTHSALTRYLLYLILIFILISFR